MERHSAGVFIGISVAFFVFMTGFTGYRIDTTRRTNLAAAERAADLLAARAASLAAQATPGGAGLPAAPWSTALFKGGMREAFEAQGRLLAAAVRSDSDGILWFMARNRAWLVEPREITPQWRGVPVYRVSRGYEALVTAPVGGGPVLDALFVVFGREDLFPVVRDDLYLFLAFLLACGIYVLLATGLSEERAPAPSSERASVSLAAEPAPPGAEPAQPAIPPAQPAVERPQAAVTPAVERAQPAVTPEQLAEAMAPPAAPPPAQPPPAERVRSLTSPATGLQWAEHLGPRLAAEVMRAASADQDISFARVALDDGPEYMVSESAAVEAARVIREAFPIADLLFESGPGAFSVILPDTDLDLAVRRLEALRGRLEERGLSASIGATARGARLIEENTLLVEAEIATDKARREGGNRVIGFRADPARFRAVLSAS